MAFSGTGSGTSEDPYIITDVQQLQEMKDDLSAHYALGNDIDASDTVNWTDEHHKGFIPVGETFVPFAGSFDGRGHVIDGLYSDRTGSVGLFGRIDNALVQRVGLENVEIKNAGDAGAIAGNCSSTATIRNSYATGSVQGSTNVGGLVGYLEGTLERSYANVNVSPAYGSPGLGGLAGEAFLARIINSYAIGNVNGLGGGLLGRNLLSSISQSYWDKETTGQTTSDGGGTGKTTVEMMQQTTYAGWNFDDDWRIDEGKTYPVIRVFHHRESRAGLDMGVGVIREKIASLHVTPMLNWQRIETEVPLHIAPVVSRDRMLPSHLRAGVLVPIRGVTIKGASEMTYPIKQGDTMPMIEAQLTDENGDPINLLGADVWFCMESGLSAPVEIRDALEGAIRYTWRLGDTDKVGRWSAEFVVKWSDEHIQRVPMCFEVLVERSVCED